MKTISAIVKELFGLFVDDGSLALEILALLVVIAFLISMAAIDMSQAAALLVAGNILALVENVLRSKNRT
jgi:hypothetical protein